MSDKTTHFGYEDVTPREKTRRVGAVFDSVAERYDAMNDLMSLGLHRVWKRYAVWRAAIKPGQRVLDLAGGTGDLAALLSAAVGDLGHVVLADINARMLQRGRERLIDQGIVNNVIPVQANAECLPFQDAAFDCVIIGFGLRNVTHMDPALAAMQRVLKPGGRAVVLEFSHPAVPGLDTLYDFYSFKVLPVLGRIVARDAASYRYLAESIRKHPAQEELKTRMEQAGFERCDYTNLAGGIIAVHSGYRL